MDLCVHTYVTRGQKQQKPLPWSPRSHTLVCCSGAREDSPREPCFKRVTKSLPADLILRHHNVTTASEAKSWGGSRKWASVCVGCACVCVCVCECVSVGILLDPITTWNYWHMDWGLEILWHKDLKCNAICFHRLWLFSGENIAARQKPFKECHQSSQSLSQNLNKWVKNSTPKV